MHIENLKKSLNKYTLMFKDRKLEQKFVES